MATMTDWSVMPMDNMFTEEEYETRRGGGHRRYLPTSEEMEVVMPKIKDILNHLKQDKNRWRSWIKSQPEDQRRDQLSRFADAINIPMLPPTQWVTTNQTAHLDQQIFQQFQQAQWGQLWKTSL